MATNLLTQDDVNPAVFASLQNELGYITDCEVRGTSVIPTEPIFAKGCRMYLEQTGVYFINASPAGVAPSWDGVPVGPIGSGVSSFNTRSGAVVPQAGDYDKTLVGLADVDDTSDADKPISTATQTALNLKLNDNMATGRLLGRSSAGAGAVQEITIGDGLEMIAGELSSTGLNLFSGDLTQIASRTHDQDGFNQTIDNAGVWTFSSGTNDIVLDTVSQQISFGDGTNAAIYEVGQMSFTDGVDSVGLNQLDVDGKYLNITKGGLNFGDYVGTGSPEGVVVSELASIYRNQANGSLWSKTSDAGLNTGWTLVGSVLDTLTVNKSIELNAGTQYGVLALGDFPTGGSIGTALATVDVTTYISIAQGTSAQTLILPTPTITTDAKPIIIENKGTEQFIMAGNPISSGDIVTFVYNTTGWVLMRAGQVGGGWAIISVPATLVVNSNYILLGAGTYTLPAGASSGDVIEVIPSAAGVLLSNPSGSIFSSPGAMVNPIELPLYTKFTIFSVGGDNWSLIKQFDARIDFPDQVASGVLGDNNNFLSNVWTVDQTTASVDLTSPAVPLPATYVVQVQNTGSATFTFETAVIAPGKVVQMLWNGLTWTAVGAGEAILDPWSASTSYVAGNTVTQGSRTIRRTAIGTSGASFDNTEAASWTLVENNATTAFVGSNYYYSTELVTAEARTLTRGVSGVSAATIDLDRINWSVVIPLPTADWVASIFYYAGDDVFQGGFLYQRIANGTSGLTFDATEETFWTKEIGGGSIPAWVSGVAYGVGDTVVTEFRIYRAVTAGTSSALFATDRARWVVIASLRAGTDWTASTYYYANDVVRQGSGLARRITSGDSLAVFDASEGSTWTRISQASLNTAWAATIYYYVGDVVVDSNILYTRNTAGVSGASFDVTEQGQWRNIGDANTAGIKTISGIYQALQSDGSLFMDSSAGVVTLELPLSLPEGKFLTVTYIQTANSITFAGTGGATVISPTTYLPVASFVAPGAIGQVGSTQWYRIASVFYFNG